MNHYFADHQFCLKCGKWEGDPDADDCTITDEQWEQLRNWQQDREDRIAKRVKELRGGEKVMHYYSDGRKVLK